MSRYNEMFSQLAKKKQGAFIPFVVLFDPDRSLSKEIINALIEGGADALELGIAFSDPLADGPTIQKAGLRALKNKSTVKDALSLVREIRLEHAHIPIGILTYANLVVKNSAAWFYSTCHASGVDSVLVADVPLHEFTPFYEQARLHNIAPVLIAPPNLPLERCRDLASCCEGYTYVVTRTGVTGANEHINLGHQDLLKALKASNAPPAVFGFGISTPEHVKKALSEGAAGVISGSKVVAIIEKNLAQKDIMLQELTDFARSMKKATEL
jgi:tryptophan synthase alpha chain